MGMSENSNIDNLPILGGIIKERPSKLPINLKLIFLSIVLLNKWAWQDSNLRPTDYESVALTN